VLFEPCLTACFFSQNAKLNILEEKNGLFGASILPLYTVVCNAKMDNTFSNFASPGQAIPTCIPLAFASDKGPSETQVLGNLSAFAKARVSNGPSSVAAEQDHSMQCPNLNLSGEGPAHLATLHWPPVVLRQRETEHSR
jgi:hypothetical protein